MQRKTWGQAHCFTPNPVNLSLYCSAGSLSQGGCQSFWTCPNRSGSRQRNDRISPELATLSMPVLAPIPCRICDMESVGVIFGPSVILRCLGGSVGRRGGSRAWWKWARSGRNVLRRLVA